MTRLLFISAREVYRLF